MATQNEQYNDTTIINPKQGGDYCGDFAVLYCSHCGARYLVHLGCGKRTCSHCAYKRYKRIEEQVLKIVENFRYPAHIVLTLERVQDLGEGVRFIKKSFTRLKRYKKWRSTVKCAFGTIETKPKPDGWHVHIHLIADCIWLDVEELSRMWEQATKGRGKIVYITRAGNSKGLVKEVLKYIFKVALMNEEHKREFEEVLRNVKLVVRDRFSLLDFTEISEHLPAPLKCQRCGGDVEWLEGVSRIVPRYEIFPQIFSGIT